MIESDIKQINRFSLFFEKNKSIISAGILAMLAVVFFLIIRFPEFFRPIHYFSQRWYGVAVLAIYLCVSYILCNIQDWSRSKLLSIWLQTNILFLFSIAYFLRVNNNSITFSTIDISTGLVFIPLTIFIFLVNRNLFGKNIMSLAHNLGQVMLVSLCVFSLVYYIEIDNTSQRSFSNDFLLQVFRLPTYIWLVVGAFTISIISTLSLKVKEWVNSLYVFLFFLITTIQTEIILNNLNLGYWAKTLIVVIVWDYLFNAILSFLKYPDYNRHKIKLIVSTVYHIFLLVIIFLFNYPSF
jgi:hypothetical protein